MTPREFVRSATGRPLTTTRSDDEACRLGLVERFRRVHDAIDCEHDFGEGLVLADAVLSLDVPGPVVECGCYRGGMTAKLAWVCELTGRALYVCDGFRGLPRPGIEAGAYRHFPSRREVVAANGPCRRFREGDYTASIGEVLANVESFGRSEVCRFVAGWFAETLPRLEVAPALVTIDVDLVESARECVRWLWPRLVGPVFYTHEAFLETYVEGLLDESWWVATFGNSAPSCEGAESGLSPTAGCTARLLKSATENSES